MDTKDWRLPNVYELSTILDNTKSEKPYAVAGLVHTSPSRYWSSTTDTLNTTSAWHVSFSSGYVYARSKTDGIYFCCVRGKQLNFDNLSLLKKKGGVKVAQEHVDKLSPKAQEIKAKKEAKERAERDRQAEYDKKHACDGLYPGKNFQVSTTGILGGSAAARVTGVDKEGGQVSFEWKRVSGNWESEETSCNNLKTLMK